MKDLHHGEFMHPIGRGNTPLNAQTESVTPATVSEQSPTYAATLTLSSLSKQTFDTLHNKLKQEGTDEKILAQLAHDSLNDSRLQLSTKQPTSAIAQYETPINNHTLVIEAKLNQRTEYDILAVA